MTRITSIKELQTVCDDLYDYFVERLAQVTEIETIEDEHSTDIYLHVVKDKYNHNCLHIDKWNSGDLWFWADGYNGLLMGSVSDHNAIEVIRTTETISDKGFRVLDGKKYTNKNGQKTADFKKRAILLNLKAKLEVLFKDYL